jgi:hypothetical protein
MRARRRWTGLVLGAVFAGRALAADIIDIVPFAHAPFPLTSAKRGHKEPFFDVQDGVRRGHTGRDGTVYWENETYRDNRVLLAIPSNFNPRRPATIVVFLHGNQALLERDVRDRQRVPEQLARAGLNAVLVAPQFAVDALDSSAGRFGKPGSFARFLDEAAVKLDALMRREFGAKRRRPDFRKAPVILVAYSGGYYPAAFAVSIGRAEQRLRGIVLLDALYSDEERFAAFIAKHRRNAFFFSTYTEGTRLNNERLQSLLSAGHVPQQVGLPKDLRPGSVYFLPLAPDVDHFELLSRAWADEPLADLLRRVNLTVPPRHKRLAKASHKHSH